MLPIEEYLERRGAKYFVTVLMLFYVLGTIIFNVYLRSIGLYEFALLQLRYMFIGFTFGIITITVPLLLLLIRRMIWGSGEDWTKKEKTERAKIQNKIEKIVLIVFIPWILIYALYIFPLISPGFGGGKPIEARLIGDADQIRKINTIIARETGIESSTLPYELYGEDTGLAIGTNVQILDQSKDRYLLLLTKDLYLSSQSQVAKKLIESGDGEKIDIEETRNFKNKPLPISSKGIETITLALYDPPKILTKTDLEVAAATIAVREGSTQKVSQILQEVEPQKAEVALAAVKKTAQEIVRTTPAPKKNTFTIPKTPDSGAVTLELSSQYDTVWLDVRSELFGDASLLQGVERKGVDKDGRVVLVTKIQELLATHFSEKVSALDVSASGYLSIGSLYDVNFPKVLLESLRGAEGVDDFIVRVNALSYSAPERKPFEAIQADVVSFFDVSVLEQDTETNRNYISQKVSQYLQKEAPEKESVWKDTRYILDGKVQPGFSGKLKEAFEGATSWDGLQVSLEGLYEGYLNPPVEEESVIEEPIEGAEESSQEEIIEEEAVEATPAEEEPVSQEESPASESATDADAAENTETSVEEEPAVIEPQAEVISEEEMPDVTSEDSVLEEN